MPSIALHLFELTLLLYFYDVFLDTPQLSISSLVVSFSTCSYGARSSHVEASDGALTFFKLFIL